MKCEKESKCLYRYADNDAGYWCGKWEGCKDMNMGENEILRDYHEAKDKFRQVKILAEQNLIKPKEMAQWLKDHGETVDKRYFSVGKTPAKVRAIEPQADISQSAKADAGKPRLSLVPMAIIWAIAYVREFGVKKYKDPENWRNVSPERYKDALLRHITAYIEDENSTDEESGLLHLWHAACNICFLIALRWKKDKERLAG